MIVCAKYKAQVSSAEGRMVIFPLCGLGQALGTCCANQLPLKKVGFQIQVGYLPGAMMCEDWGLVWASEFM